MLLGSTIFTVSAFAEDSGFKDISNSYWAKNEIEFLRNQGIISGDGGGRFHPNDNITREQAALMLGRLFNLKNQGASYAINDLIDFDVLGKSAAENRNGYMTRGEMAKAIAVAYSLNSTIEYPFTDVPKNSYYAKYVNALADSGITKGYADGTFRPDEPITRAQFCVFVTKGIKLGVKFDLKDRIRIGSTLEDVLNLLGEPNQKYDLVEEGDKRLWIYTNTVEKSKLPPVLNNLSLSNYIQVQFKLNNKVQHLAFFVKPTNTFKETSNMISHSVNLSPYEEYEDERVLVDSWLLDSKVYYGLQSVPYLRTPLIFNSVKKRDEYVDWKPYWPEDGFSLTIIASREKSL